MRTYLFVLLAMICILAASPALAGETTASTFTTLSQLPSEVLTELPTLSEQELAAVEGKRSYSVSNSVNVYQSNSCYGNKCRSMSKVTKCYGSHCRTHSKVSKCYGYCSNTVKIYQCAGHGCGNRRR